MHTRSQSIAASSSHASVDAPGQAATQSTSRPKPHLGARRHAIIAGAVSVTTLASWLMLRSALPERTGAATPPEAPQGGTAAASTGNPTPGAPAGGTYTLETMTPQSFEAFFQSPSAELLAAVRTDPNGCLEPMAQLSLIATANATGQLRVISGTYTSPWYQLKQAPLSIPLPYPAPFAQGKGLLIVEGRNMQHGVLALTPAMSFGAPASTSHIQIPVVWPVDQYC